LQSKNIDVDKSYSEHKLFNIVSDVGIVRYFPAWSADWLYLLYPQGQGRQPNATSLTRPRLTSMHCNLLTGERPPYCLFIASVR